MNPDALIDYNVNMCLINKSDMQIGVVECEENGKMVPQAVLTYNLCDPP